MTPQTLATYRCEFTEFQAWASSRRLTLASPAAADRALKQYMEWLLLQREAPQVGRWALFGTCLLKFPHLGRGQHVMPLARASLRGWLKEFPGRVRDPCPLSVAYDIGCNWLAEMTMDGLFRAAALALQVDTYLRPGALFSILRDDLIKPHRAAGLEYQQWMLVVAPSTRKARTKTGEQDDSIVLGIADRSYVKTVASELHFLTQPGTTIFKAVTLAKYEAAFRRSAQELDLHRLRLVPHCLRHTGPSHDRYHGFLSQAGIKDRGKWASDLSVRRYEKHAMLLRQLALLEPDQARRARKSAKDFPRLLLARLAALRSKPP